MSQRNELVLLETVLAERRPQAPSGLTDSEFFEFFAFDQILKEHELSDEELLDGQLGGGDEGGVDGVYVFEDDRLLEEDSDYSRARKGVHLTLYVVQAKRKDSFGETALQKVSDALGHVLDLARSKEDLIQLGLYHDGFVERFEIFREAVRKLANRRPVIRVVVAYASRGDTDDVNPKVSRRAGLLEEQIHAALPSATATVAFYGARELYDLSQQEPSDELELPYQGAPPVRRRERLRRAHPARGLLRLPDQRWGPSPVHLRRKRPRLPGPSRGQRGDSALTRRR